MQQSRQDKGGINFQQDEQNLLFQMQSDLLQTWSSLHVQQYYQNLVLNYLDTLPTYKVQQHITKQIKATNEGKSPYFKLSNNLNSRKQSLSALEGLINTNKKMDIDSKSLTSICSLMNSLRDSNLLFAETLIQLLRQYSLKQQPVSDECMQMFQNLDEDNKFLKESLLKDYILFKQQYDPFFLHHYDMKGEKAAKKSNQIIDHLFALSLSYVYRLLKANNQIIQIVKQGKLSTAQNMETRLNSRRISESLIKRKKATLQNQLSKEEKSKNYINFRRRHLSLNNTKQKKLGESKSTFQKKYILRSRRSQSFIQKDQTNDQYQKSIEFEEKGLKNHSKTEFQEKEQKRFIPQNFRIKPIHPKQPFNQEKNRSTITNEQDSPVTFKRKFNLMKNKLHPLKHFKKLYPQSETKTEYQEENQKSPVSNCISLLKREEQLPQLNRFESQDKSPKLSQNYDQEYNIPKSIKKELKMRPGKYDLPQTMKLLKKLPLKNRSKETIMNGSLEEYLRKHQSYVSEFSIDSQVQIIAISLVLSHQVYLIKLWAISQACSEQNSLSLFKKYIDYLQKITQLKQIYYQGQLIKEIKLNGFQQIKPNYYVRSRVSKLKIKVSEFEPFLSIKCSNIVIQQENPSAKLFYSDDIQSFSKENSYGCLSVITVNKQKMNQNIKMIAKISEGIENMRTLNTLLQDQNLDTYEISNKTKITNIKALRLNLNTSFAVPFLSSEGYLKFFGQMIQTSSKSKIYSVKCSASNYILYFGKNMTNVIAFKQNLIKPKKEGSWFSVKMFSKQIYGRIQVDSPKQGSYGNWQINLSWQDELQGKIKHTMTNCEHFGTESFYVAIEIQRQIIYCFEVNQKDFLL